ncbi:EAL domain-containing response regulator [Rhodoferax aquaticus]|uniref:EAL domain-containing response regulator n=1 Tax=Rhodoferax aquaticus TaxID=2527691 RepID=A0A515EQS3_9BURK|nr:EAL domain-containing protein [Rhodoferax aquaticus]QDL55012.1 EAL domain-containing response regulator [Rhodoferax aquaticus]
MKILIAEDEPSLQQNLQWMLEMEGYEVIAANDGQDAYAKACTQHPALVITDVMMPLLDGYGLVKALRENPATSVIPIVMLSAKADRSDVRAGMNLGADDYLTKPYRREELLDTVHARIARSAGLADAATRIALAHDTATQLDPLTSLPNRDTFEKQLEALVAAEQPGRTAIICFGVDGFSKVNESLGKVAGDWVLSEVAMRLSLNASTDGHAMLEHRAVSRIAGDVFAIAIQGPLDAQSVEQHAQGYLAVLAKPYQVQGQELFLTACAGACLQSQDRAAPLLMQAESALHHAKPAGPGSYLLFDNAMTQQVMRRLNIHNELHRALDNGELQLFYQPQVCARTGALKGFEALLRWQHPRLGWVSPAEFIPIAEDSGIIVRIGEWVMRTAATQAAAWVAMGHSDFRMAVNLSVRQFAGSKLPSVVERVLQETGLAPHILELEVTESMALQSVASTLSTLHACKALGVKLSMDDFGTGYSSLAYLKRYPLNALKIDQSFVRNITQDTGDAAITRAIVAMAHSFGMSVIAEGVETKAQLAFLRELGCEEFQGYLFSRPVPAPEAIKCFAGYTDASD